MFWYLNRCDWLYLWLSSYQTEPKFLWGQSWLYCQLFHDWRKQEPIDFQKEVHPILMSLMSQLFTTEACSLASQVNLDWWKLTLSSQEFKEFDHWYFIKNTQLKEELLKCTTKQSEHNTHWMSCLHFQLRAYQGHSILPFLHISRAQLVGL